MLSLLLSGNSILMGGVNCVYVVCHFIFALILSLEHTLGIRSMARPYPASLGQSPLKACPNTPYLSLKSIC